MNQEISGSEMFSVGRKTILMSYLVQILQFGASILILPFILVSVDDKTLGVWYIFLSVSALAQLIDFGFSSSLSRNISFVFSGANEIVKDGSPYLTEDKLIDYKLLFSLIYTSKKTYGIISLVILVFLLIPGSLYIVYATKSSNIDNILWYWLLFTISVAINYYYGYVLVFIRGRGRIDQFNELTIISKVSYVVIILILLYCNLGLLALILSNILSACIMRGVGLSFFWDSHLKSKKRELKEWKPKNLFNIIWYNAKRYGLTTLTSYGFSHANIFIAGLYLSVKEVAKLGLLLQICNIIVTISRVFLNSYYPRLCSLWVSNSLLQIKQLFMKCQIISYVSWFLLFGAVLLLGNVILNLIHSKTMLPGTVIISLYAFFYFMELTHGNCAMLISSKNTVPFYKAAIVACVVSLVLMFLFLSLDMGMISFPLAMIFANLPYNSWKWVYESVKLFKQDKSVV